MTLQAMQEDKEAADEGTDADAAERRRAREAEEWRLKQLRSGVSSQANSNFQVRRSAAQVGMPGAPGARCLSQPAWSFGAICLWSWVAGLMATLKPAAESMVRAQVSLSGCAPRWCATAELTVCRLALQPLAMDWREKIKAAKGKPAEAPQAATAKPEPVKYASKPDLEALSGGLPPGWKALWDKKSGEVFYGNPATKETSWDKPD